MFWDRLREIDTQKEYRERVREKERKRERNRERNREIDDFYSYLDCFLDLIRSKFDLVSSTVTNSYFDSF